MSDESLKGKSFLQDDNEDSLSNPKKHLYIVISDSDIDDRVLLVSVNSFKGNGREDTACILNNNDHSFIKHKSFIRYDRAKEIEENQIDELKKKGLIISKEDVSPAILKKIQNGAKQSKALPYKYRKYFAYF